MNNASDLLVFIVRNWPIIIFVSILVIAVYLVLANLAITVFKAYDDKNEEFEQYLKTFGDKVGDSKAKNLPRLIRQEMMGDNRFSNTLPGIISSQSRKNKFVNYLDKYISRERWEYFISLACLPFVFLSDILLLHTDLKYWVVVMFLFSCQSTWIKPMKKLIGYEFLSSCLKEI